MSVRLEAANSEYLTVGSMPSGGLSILVPFYVHSMPAGAARGTIFHYWCAGFSGIGAKYTSSGQPVFLDYNAGAETVGASGLIVLGWNLAFVRALTGGPGDCYLYLGGSTTAAVNRGGACGGAGTFQIGRNVQNDSGTDVADISVENIKLWSADVNANQANAEAASYTFINTTGAVSRWSLADQTDLGDDQDSHPFSGVGTLSAGPPLFGAPATKAPPPVNNIIRPRFYQRRKAA